MHKDRQVSSKKNLLHYAIKKCVENWKKHNISLLNELKKFFSIFCTLNVWAVLLVFIPLKNEKNSEKNILRKSWIITMICTSSNNPLPPLLHISSKNYWAVSSLPSLEKCRRQKSSLIKKQTSNKLTKRIFLPKFSKLLILKTYLSCNLHNHS